MIKNIPYFHTLDDQIAIEIAYLLKPKRYELGTEIIKRGDKVENIMLLKSGEIEVLVPNTSNKEELIYLDSLNEGSCFCIYAPFSEVMH